MPHCRGCPPFQKGEGLAYKGQPQGSQRRWPWERTATWDRSSSRRAPRVLPQAPNLVKSHITLDTLSETQNRGRGLGGHGAPLFCSHLPMSRDMPCLGSACSLL